MGKDKKPALFRKTDADGTESVDVVLLAEAVAAQSGGGKLSMRERAIVGILATLLGAGGTGGMLTAGMAWIQAPSPEVLQRLDKLDAAVFMNGENQIKTLIKSQNDIGKVARDTYDIVNTAHPPLGRVGVPQPLP